MILEYIFDESKFSEFHAMKPIVIFESVFKVLIMLLKHLILMNIIYILVGYLWTKLLKLFSVKKCCFLLKIIAR